MGESTATVLRDQRLVAIRRLVEDDRTALLVFGAGLPEDDLLYFEEDFRSPEIITRLANAAAAENWRQVVAVADGRIVGYSSARRLPGWSDHVAEILLLVAADWRRSGVGTALAQAIFAAARDLGAAKVIVEVLAEHTAGQAIFQRLGFQVEGRLSAHARDRDGHRRDLLILAYHVN